MHHFVKFKIYLGLKCWTQLAFDSRGVSEDLPIPDLLAKKDPANNKWVDEDLDDVKESWEDEEDEPAPLKVPMLLHDTFSLHFTCFVLYRHKIYQMNDLLERI